MGDAKRACRICCPSCLLTQQPCARLSGLTQALLVDSSPLRQVLTGYGCREGASSVASGWVDLVARTRQPPVDVRARSSEFRH